MLIAYVCQILLCILGIFFKLKKISMLMVFIKYMKSNRRHEVKVKLPSLLFSPTK